MAGKPGCNCLSAAGDRGWQARTAPTETDCMAGHVRFELRNVVANYPFESSRGFPGSEPNRGHQQTAQRQAFSRGRSLRSWHLMQPLLRIANLDARWELTNGMVWSQFVRAAWVHEFRPDRS